jgi:shikimate kinase
MARWLVLTGYMGAGKTSVGRRVANRLDRTFTDADRVIEEQAGMPVPEIFSKRGELWFRRTEERVIRDVLAGEPGVLALGGGAVESAKTRDLLRRTADVVWLKASVDVAWGRVKDSDRPLAADEGRFARRLAAREPNSREAAHLEVVADGPVDEVAARVAAWAAERFELAHPEPVAAQTCLYTTTPDDAFVLERRGRVVVGSACSGHGFKFAPAIGARLARLATQA